MIDNVTERLDIGNYSLGLFIDLSKAFDTLDHTILIHKLEFYGVRGKALDWFRSYLTNRQQYVQFNGTKSSLLNIKTGVPQGSILGPLLFLIYINDIVKASKYLYLILFADDTNVFMHHKDLNTLQKICNTELENLSHWFKANKLSLNINKTNYIFFTSRSKYKTEASKSFSIQLDGKNIERVCHAKFLGVYIDQELTWNKHIQEICTKISKNIGIMSRISYKLNTPILSKLYNTLILPYLNYCNFIWTSTSERMLTKLFILQKKAVRILSKASYHAHTDPIFKAFRLLKIKDIRYFQILGFMYRFINGTLPLRFKNYFQETSEIHSYTTRSVSNFALNITFAKTNRRKKTIRIIGPYVWNELPTHIKQSPSLPSFKYHLKNYIIQNYANQL